MTGMYTKVKIKRQNIKNYYIEDINYYSKDYYEQSMVIKCVAHWPFTGHSQVTYVTSKVTEVKRLTMIMKTPGNEAKNVFVMKLNAQSLPIYNTIVHAAESIFRRKL